MLSLCAKSLNGKWMIISGLMLGRLRFQLLGLILREIGLFLQLLMIANLQMMIVRIRILFGMVKMIMTVKMCL